MALIYGLKNLGSIASRTHSPAGSMAEKPVLQHQNLRCHLWRLENGRLCISVLPLERDTDPNALAHDNSYLCII